MSFEPTEKMKAAYRRARRDGVLIVRLKAERDQLQERHDNLWEMDRKIIGGLKAERDAAYKASLELEQKSLTEFVRGLERAKELAGYDSEVAIQAEIDKAKAEK